MLDKKRLSTITLAALIACSMLLVTTQQAEAISANPTNYNLSFFQPSSTVAMSNNLIITAKDDSNTTKSSYSGSVILTCSDPNAILPTSTTIAITNGLGTCSMYFGTAGSQTVTVTDTADDKVTGTLTVTVAPIHFSISVTPTTITAGESVNVTVTALDASDNVLTTIGSSGYGGSVDFSSTDTYAVFPAQGMPSNLVNGVGVFNITLNTAGSQTITATNKAFNLVNATTATITVNAESTATASPTSTAPPSSTPTNPPASPTATPTPAAQTADNNSLNILIIVAVVIVVAVVAIVAVVFLRKRRSQQPLPPPPPPQ